MQMVAGVSNQNMDFIKEVVEKNKNLKGFRRTLDFPFLYSVYLNNIEYAEYFLSIGANVNFYSKQLYGYSVTALMLASDLGYLDMVKFLIDNKANLLDVDENGKTVLIQATTAYYENRKFGLILKKEQGYKKIDFDDFDMSAEKYHKQLSIIKYLIGVNRNIISIKDNRGFTAYDYANVQEVKDEDIINFLKQQEPKQ